MSSDTRAVLCTYRYDPTDRLADCSPAGQGGTRFFYQKNLLATQIQGQIQHTLLRTDEHLLAHLSVENNTSDCLLLATDQQQSVITAQDVAFVYTPYGHRHPSAGPMNLPGYTGQRLEPVTGHYLLGNGYRAFNPVLMRFNSPDSLSPFGEGGLNAYAYCEGDPANKIDPSGHWPKVIQNVLARIRNMKQNLLRRTNSRELLTSSEESSVASGSPAQPSTSRTGGVVKTHVSTSEVTANPHTEASPPAPPRTASSSRSRLPVIFQKEYAVVHGEKVDRYKATEEFNALKKTIKDIKDRGGDVPYVVENNYKYYEDLIEEFSRVNKAAERPLDASTRIRRASPR
ncbi:hypothetical protein K0038_00341 [Pseudomonas syringae]|uniref:RHS repeat-associated core domain-containing protein n=1 Tax=Pseudomonas syringae TaxID=317 RepID=UPI001CAA2B2F|nr:RHS repeat-associated core domain-containing protein [Pseudomonas syringae]MCI3943350.1 hypothetical protein [Pseudomonas syringae]